MGIKQAKDGNTNNQSQVTIIPVTERNNTLKGLSPTRLLSTLITMAMEQRASDIHFESYPSFVGIRIRIDGVLQEGPKIAVSLKNGLISHIKVLSNLDIAEKRRPQDGKLKYSYQGRNLDIRVSTIPTLHGEKVVMRVLDPDSQVFTVDTLGLNSKQKDMLLDYLKMRQGIILVTGPTGSGKTTTLYTMLSRLNSLEINILTVEDPIEYEIEGINQTRVHNEIGYTFANALRAFLRQDPDVMFIGEIRDTETARIAIRAALTGHLVLSTVHTNSSLETIVRLMNMGIEPYLLAATLKLVIAQRLIRKLCTDCHGEWTNRNGSQNLCEQCGGTGYVGREGIFEFLPITDSIRRLMHDGGSMHAIEQLPEVQKLQTLEMAGMKKVREEITSKEEVGRVIG